MNTDQILDSKLSSKLLEFSDNEPIYILFPFISNYSYLQYLAQILCHAKQEGISVKIIDANWIFPPLKVSKELRYSAGRARENFLSSMTTQYFENLEIIRCQLDRPPKIENISFKQAYEIDSNCGNSIHSMLISHGFPYGDYDLKSRRKKSLFNDYLYSYISTVATLNKLFVSRNVKKVIVFNGRWPEQAAARSLCMREGIDVLFLEHGKPNGRRFHLERFQTQEYAKMREFFEREAISGLPSGVKDKVLWADNWLYHQRSDESQNPFISKPKMAHSSSSPEGSLVVLFNSSFDERFSNLGIEMNGWASQEQAFSEVTSLLISRNHRVILRIHPNTANKSWHELINLVKAIKELPIEIILPWDEISTYSLLEKASSVVTWGSTVSLESTAMGIPTFNLGRTYYDSIIDVKLLSPDMIKNGDFDPIVPDQLKSRIGIFVTRNWGHELLNSSVSIIDQQLSLSGGNSLISEVRTYKMKMLIHLLGNRLASKPNTLKSLLSSFLGENIARKILSNVLILCVKFY